jgi:REP element-mobilizing transposase RayT
MGRAKRVLSKTGIYHITSRGINAQNIYEDKEDKERFIRILLMVCEKYGIFICDQSLMSNHFHLKLKEDSPMGIVKALQILKSTYSRYFNRKYGRKGTLYEDRFFSMPVEDIEYFTILTRYIHQNPLKVGEGLEWTSFSLLARPFGGEDKAFLEYKKKKGKNHSLHKKRKSSSKDSFTKTERKKLIKTSREAWETLSKGSSKTLKERTCERFFLSGLVRGVLSEEIAPDLGEDFFLAFVRKGLDRKDYDKDIKKYVLEEPGRRFKTELEAESAIRKLVKDMKSFRQRPSGHKEEIEELLEEGVSIRQIARVTGISREAIRRAIGRV